nr:asparagine synthase (glutamine-hydrolyzing) [Streptomyces sp. NBC_00899]WSX81205.1 asparagine synthase (glutamine-hydrolyzing) [Streptomyces sp. NBC_00899]
MCGIVGWVDFGEDLRTHRPILDRMVETMRLRGPDDSGLWVSAHAALGHRRLAVIDIEGGRQPMLADRDRPSGPTVLVYSGEVYNFPELRSELADLGHVFQTRSDTEVVLHAYRQWGAACAEHLNGMFAFAVWDAEHEALVLIRDRMGVKPLYYYEMTNGVLFASEPKGIMANPRFTPLLDEQDLPILLNARLGLPHETPLRGLKEVQPGHIVRIDRSGAREHRYWALESAPHPHDLDATVGHVRDLLEDIVRRQLVADVPVSSMLSGGLDSTYVSALAAREYARTGHDPLTTYCVQFEGDEEHFSPTVLRPEIDAPYARLAAEQFGTDHVPVTLQTRDLVEVLPGARASRDLPSLGQFDTSMYLLFAEMRKRSTVGLSAEAADELFGGYPWYHDPRTTSWDGFPWLGDAPRLTDCLAPDVAARIRPDEAEQDRYRTLLARVPRLPGEDPHSARMREVLFLSMQRPLLYLLDRKDRMSMANGLEVRVPYCDHRLVEYAWNIPWQMKIADGREKSPLRLAARGLVPEQTLTRPKSAYPGTHDPSYEVDVIRGIDKLLADRSSPLFGALDRQRVEELRTRAEKTMTWLNAAHLLLPLLEADIWMRTYNVRLA